MQYRLLLLWAVALLTLGLSSAFKVGYGPPYFDEAPPPMPFDKDYNDLREYTPIELEVRRELMEMKKSRSFISNFVPPTCNSKKWNRMRCCLSFKLLEKKKKFCLKAAVRLRKLSIYFAFILNRMPLYEHEILLSEFCMGMPFMKKISACIHFYYFNFRFEPDFYMKTCAQLTVAGIFALQFNCIEVKNGVVKFDSSVEPEDKGIFVLSFKDGKMVFEFNNPIPAELMEAIKNFGQVVKQTFVVIVRGVVDTAKKVWTAIKSWFGCLFGGC